MEIRHLRYFRAVAEELHFGRAAAQLRISQPPLTVAIKQLEEELGVKLFDRTTRNVRLTQAGETFQRRVGSILLDIEDAVAEVGDVALGERGRLSVGFVSSASYSVLPETIRRFGAEHPGVRQDIRSLTSAEQVDLLLEGELDVGLIRDPAEVPGLVFTRVAEEEILAVLPEEHPLAGEQAVSAKSLLGEPLVLFPYRQMPGYVSRLMKIFTDVGGSPRVVQHAIHQETVLGLVSAGVGISVLPAAIRKVKMPGVVTVPILEQPMSEMSLAYVENPSALVRNFLACALAVADTGVDDAGGVG